MMRSTKSLIFTVTELMQNFRDSEDNNATSDMEAALQWGT